MLLHPHNNRGTLAYGVDDLAGANPPARSRLATADDLLTRVLGSEWSDMAYESVDILQQALTQDVFHYAKDAKKAAGRALGTVIELMTFYLLKHWALDLHMGIERRLPEYANADITHNVEFSLHPSAPVGAIDFDEDDLPLTPRKIHSRLEHDSWSSAQLRGTQLLSSTKVLRNACVLSEDDDRFLVAHLDDTQGSHYRTVVRELLQAPFAIVECKRVGVEEGAKRGPQTIEKAKQGSYVARTLSALQKVRSPDGEMYGILDVAGERLRYEPYGKLLKRVIGSNLSSLLKGFVLTVGVVSNHGNWFSTDDQSKELKILAQSYDWLLFLTDDGISRFVDDLLIHPARKYRIVQAAFARSYSGGARRDNVFTKVRIDLAADRAIRGYLRSGPFDIESAFSVVSPRARSIQELAAELTTLAGKDWEEILR